LNRLVNVKDFITKHARTYDSFEVRFIDGADPELLFLKENDEVGERHTIDEMSTEEICQLVDSRGLKKRDNVPPMDDEMRRMFGEEEEEEVDNEEVEEILAEMEAEAERRVEL